MTLQQRLSQADSAFPGLGCVAPFRRSVLLPSQNEWEEKVVEDGSDALSRYWREIHEQVVADKIEGHREHGNRDAIEIDLSAIVGALVNGMDPKKPLIADDAVAYLCWRRAGAREKTRERDGDCDREERGARLPHAGQCCEEITAKGAGVGQQHRVVDPVTLEGGEDQFVLVVPSTVEHGFAGLRSDRDRFHR